MSCNCEVCSRYRRFQENVEKLPKEQQLYFVELYEYLTDVEFERDWLKTIVDGTNKNAEQILARKRNK